MNNTSGQSCSLCEPGFFGDAIVLKDCQGNIVLTFYFTQHYLFSNLY